MRLIWLPEGKVRVGGEGTNEGRRGFGLAFGTCWRGLLLLLDLKDWI